MLKVLVLSDTHAPRRWKGVPQALMDPLRRCDLILHAGDVCTPAALDELEGFAPVRAVLGNNDGADVAAWGAPPELALELEGVRVAMIHIAGPKQGRGRRMGRQFPDADIVVFGHSHMPVDMVEDGTHLFNPGSPTDPRREPMGSFGWLELGNGRILSHGIHLIPRPVPTRSVRR
ncbi:MAG: metallophosphoesterase family protein [Propionibacteriaceae bacterium]|nr:metallophosphoesterase family protein [Propionibacteriaceae bacterium]